MRWDRAAGAWQRHRAGTAQGRCTRSQPAGRPAAVGGWGASVWRHAAATLNAVRSPCACLQILDEYFGNVCELDLVFGFHKVPGAWAAGRSGGGAQEHPSRQQRGGAVRGV